MDEPIVPYLPEMTPQQKETVHTLHRSMVQTLTSRHHAIGVVVVAALRTLAWAIAHIPDKVAREQTIASVAGILPLYVNLFRPQTEK